MILVDWNPDYPSTAKVRFSKEEQDLIRKQFSKLAPGENIHIKIVEGD